MHHEETRKSEQSLLLKNMEVLTRTEDTNYSYRYPNLSGKPVECTLYVYLKGNIVVKKSESTDSNYDASAEYRREKKKGIKDLCPNNGDGCNPYSCQEIAY